MITRVILVRHGESTFNTLSKVQGRGNSQQPELQSVLTDRGQQQAALAGIALQGLPIDAAYASPLVRARQTAEIILGKRDTAPLLHLSDALYEIDLSLWEGMTFDEVKAKYPQEHEKWQNAPHELLLDGRYPVLELFAQARILWREILAQHQGKTVLMVGHSGINRALISVALGLTPPHYHRLAQGNCAMSVLNFSGTEVGKGVQLESLNLLGHLKSENVLPSTRKDHTGPRLLLVRHGETEWNRQKRFQGQIDVPLNPRGEEQARQAAQFLQTVPIHLAFSSPLLRPKQTAEAILGLGPTQGDRAAVPFHLLDDLKEISHGLWEGKYESEIESEFPGMLTDWQKAPETVQMPEGENLQQVWERVALAWKQIVTSTPDGQTALVVAHDAVNKAILCQLFDLDPSYFWTFKQGNGGVCVIDYSKGWGKPPMLQAMNITTHLSDSVLDVTAAGAL